MINHHLQTPYNFSEESTFRMMLLHVIQYIRDEFHRQGNPKTTIISSPLINYKVTSGEITVEEELRQCSQKKTKILITLSVSFLGGQWSTKHKKRNAIVTKTVMEENILKIFGEKIPWKKTTKQKPSKE